MPTVVPTTPVAIPPSPEVTIVPEVAPTTPKAIPLSSVLPGVSRFVALFHCIFHGHPTLPLSLAKAALTARMSKVAKSTVAVFVAGPNVYIMFSTGKYLRIPMHAVIFSDKDWDVHSPPQHSL